MISAERGLPNGNLALRRLCPNFEIRETVLAGFQAQHYACLGSRPCPALWRRKLSVMTVSKS